ncbi:MAG: beta-propeller domain-containing protein [Candidatus Thermoplasmatota archaeon]|nr:beta-propeller domain-containing protein [Candidatus Thermoplasmatota archaeon]
MKDKKLKLAGIVLTGIIILGTFVYAITVQPTVYGNMDFPYYDLQTFGSYEELTEFLESSSNQYSNYNWRALGDGSMEKSFEATAAPDGMNFDESGGETVDYSQTNVQVAGVDEPDVVKTDGTYLYIVSNGKIMVVKAYPTDDADIECEITFNESIYVQNVFISDLRLVVFAETYDSPVYKGGAIDEMSSSVWYGSPNTYIKIFDLEDIENPILVKDIAVEGSYSGARMIEDFVYVITTQYSYNYGILDEDQVVVPRIMIDDKVKDVPLSDIHYVDIPEKSSTVTNIVSVNVHDDKDEVHAEVFLLGNSHTLYVSNSNIYIAYPTGYYDYVMLEELIDELVMPVLPESIKEEFKLVDTLSLEDYQKKTVTEWILQNYVDSMDENQKQAIAREIVRQTERTIIHRISVADGEIQYKAQGSIPGFVKNQFSLSEYDEYLRVSTTVEGWMVRSYISSIESQNNVYVLDMDLEIVGSLEDLASGEQIYATRFIGDRCYLVTFEQIDPFFVIDLSKPTNPEVLGELKIPGYSTYLHPYDETHIIGIGRDDEKVKISLFDVSDLENPIELSKYEIENDDEDWYWTQSSALYEHKAFLFDKEKNLLVIPVGDYSKESAYVFDISVEGGIELKGTITHDLEVEPEEEHDSWDGYYYTGEYGNSIKRTLYIEDVLYTVSDNMVKMNDLETLEELNSVNLG